MNKKSLWLFLIVTLIITLPAFQGNATISPEEAANLTTTGEDNDTEVVTPDDWSGTYDGNTVDITEVNDQNSVILLNDTYQLEVHHNDTNIGIRATALDTGPPGMTPTADEFLFDVDFTISPSGKFLDIELPTTRIKLEQAPYAEDVWNININDEELYITMNTTEKTIGVDYLTSHMDIGADEIYFTDVANPANNFVLTRITNDEFLLMTPDGLFTVFMNSTHVFVDWVGMMIVQPIGPHLPFQWVGVAPLVAISFVDNCVMVEWEDVTIHILDEMVIMTIAFIVIHWYFLLLIEMICIFIFDLTIIFYLTVVELCAIIIYYTFEIKIYETQIVIVYEIIEIIFLFVSVFIWHITFIFHFEFWYIQIFFIIHVVLFLIIQPIRFVFIPVIIPVFIPIIYYVPIIIKEYVHIYVPYAALQIYIDVYDQDLKEPNHHIEYFVYDQLGQPIDDATVTVTYDGTAYPASFVSNGIYQVDLPASDEQEVVNVVATKPWYPDGVLQYTLNVTWVDQIETVTETTTLASPLAIIPVIAALFSVAVGTIYTRKKK